MLGGLALASGSTIAGNEIQRVGVDFERIFKESNASTLVFLFVAVECPISNRYAPVVNALYDQFSSDDLEVWTVYTDDLFSEESIAQHRSDYEYRAPSLIDFDQALARYCQATVTPEAAVFVREEAGEMRLVYRGRIDDRYVDFGKWRRQPSREDLKEVLAVISRGNARSLEARTTRAVGCYISPN